MATAIVALKPERLHKFWPFLRRGLIDVIRKNTPPPHRKDSLDEMLAHTKVRWWPEDMFAAIAYRQATCYIVSQNRRALGFFVVHPQAINFSDKTELFLWAAWAIPLRERHENDDVAGAIRDSLVFMNQLRVQGGHSRLSTLTRRGGLLRRQPYRDLFATEFTSLTLLSE